MKAAIPTATKIRLPNVSERRQVHILNPVSGGSRYFEAARRAIEKTGAEMITSHRPGEVTEITAQLFRDDPFAHAVIYGGDGTVYEAVNGIMQSGQNHTASFSVVPSGSGNDFSATANDTAGFAKGELIPLDLIRVTCGETVRYSANVTNVGFDCNVVRESIRLRRLRFIPGPATYIMGVAKTLILKKTTRAKITLSGCIDEAGNPVPDESYDQKILLSAAANAEFYGGGFHAAPTASLTDGYMVALVVNNMSRLRFVSLVGDYHEGTFVDENGTVKEKFRQFLSMRKCRKMILEGASHFCMDGEIFPTEGMSIIAETMQNAVWFAAL